MNEKRETVCCFTGHREMPLDLTGGIRQRVIETIDGLYAEGINTYYAGGARGFDALASEVVIERRAELPDLRLVIAAPHDGHTARWSAEEQARYARIAEQADEVVSLAPHYYNGCMQARNRYMVERSAVCVCYKVKDTGGTAYTVKQAKMRSLRIINLADG